MDSVKFHRYAVEDIVINKNYEYMLPKYATVLDEDDNVLMELQITFVDEE